MSASEKSGEGFQVAHHFDNADVQFDAGRMGIWLFLVDWGIAIGARAQRMTGYACIAVGFVLLAIGINALTAFIHPGGLWGGLFY